MPLSFLRREDKQKPIDIVLGKACILNGPFAALEGECHSAFRNFLPKL
jgi:hypothetical protein